MSRTSSIHEPYSGSLDESKILIHNFTFENAQKIPGVLDFDQNSVIWAKDHDTVISLKRIDPDYLKYLETLGWNFSNVTFFHPSISTHGFTDIFYDRQVISLVKKSKAKYLDLFHLTSEEAKFSQKVGLPIYGNVTVAEKHGTKSGFRKLAKKLKVPIAHGMEDVTSLDKILESLRTLFDAGAIGAFVKVDEGLGGQGSILVRALEIRRENQLQKKLQSFLNRFAHKNVQPTVVVEEEVAPIELFLTAHFQVLPNKKMKLLQLAEQIFDQNEQRIVGNSFPARVGISDEKKIITLCKKMLTFFVSQGYVGYCGFDLVKTTTGELFFLETNIRRMVGAATPYELKKRLRLPMNTPYVCYTLEEKKLKGQSFKALSSLLRLDTEPQGKLPKLVIYNVGPLSVSGEFNFVVFGDTVESAQVVAQKTKATIEALARPTLKDTLKTLYETILQLWS